MQIKFKWQFNIIFNSYSQVVHDVFELQEEINKITRKDQHNNMEIFIFFEFRENMFRKLNFLFQKLILRLKLHIFHQKNFFLNFEGFSPDTILNVKKVQPN